MFRRAVTVLRQAHNLLPLFRHKHAASLSVVTPCRNNQITFLFGNVAFQCRGPVLLTTDDVNACSLRLPHIRWCRCAIREEIQHQQTTLAPRAREAYASPNCRIVSRLIGRRRVQTDECDFWENLIPLADQLVAEPAIVRELSPGGQLYT